MQLVLTTAMRVAITSAMNKIGKADREGNHSCDIKTARHRHRVRAVLKLKPFETFQNTNEIYVDAYEADLGDKVKLNTKVEQAAAISGGRLVEHVGELDREDIEWLKEQLETSEVALAIADDVVETVDALELQLAQEVVEKAAPTSRVERKQLAREVRQEVVDMVVADTLAGESPDVQGAVREIIAADVRKAN